MSWTKSEKILIPMVVVIIFIVLNIAFFFELKSWLHDVSIYPKEYDLTQKQFIKNMRAKVHPFYRLSDAGHVGFESDVSVELNFASVSPSSENDGGNIKVLVLGGMETNFYYGISNVAPSVVPDSIDL